MKEEQPKWLKYFSNDLECNLYSIREYCRKKRGLTGHATTRFYEFLIYKQKVNKKFNSITFVYDVKLVINTTTFWTSSYDKWINIKAGEESEFDFPYIREFNLSERRNPDTDYREYWFYDNDSLIPPKYMEYYIKLKRYSIIRRLRES